MNHLAGHPAGSARLAAPFRILATISVLFLVAALPVFAQDTKTKEKKFEISTPWGGLSASEKASLHDVGLPAYPGSRLHRESPDDDAQAQLSFWTDTLKMKLVVLHFESDDPIEKISAYYQKALAKYGKVLNCTGAEKKTAKDKDSDELTCGDSEPSEGGVELRAGTKEKQHIVGISPSKSGAGTEFALLYLEARKTPKEAQ